MGGLLSVLNPIMAVDKFYTKCTFRTVRTIQQDPHFLRRTTETKLLGVEAETPCERDVMSSWGWSLRRPKKTILN